MREIKFRGLTPKGEWIEGDLAKLMDADNLCIMPKSYFATRDFGEEDDKGNPIIQDELAIGGFIKVKSETVGQFTGLTDKNGKEIYEGDILSGYLDLGKSAVSFKNGSFMWNGELLGYDYTENGLDFLNTSQWATVVGNIHENQELLS